MANVLVVDDDPAIRGLIDMILWPEHTPRLSKSAGEAERYLLREELNFDLVITDISMPGNSVVKKQVEHSLWSAVKSGLPPLRTSV